MGGLYIALRLIMEGRFLALARAAIAGVIPIGIGVALAFWLQYVEPGDSLIDLGLNAAAVHGVLPSIALSFGAMLVGGLAGLWMAARRHEKHADVFGVIVGVSVLFYFFVDVKDHQHVYVGWRSGHFLFIAFAGLAGYALQELCAKSSRARAATVVVALMLATAAAPTVAIDFYNTQDVSNRAVGPGFRWTLVLAPEEVHALDWIKTFTPKDAIVQVEPSVRDSFTWAYVPAFAERRMAAGLPISMVPLEKYQTASAKVKEIYTASDARAAYDRAKSLGIEYLIVGEPERETYKAFEPMVQAQPFLFQPAFREGAVAIYRIAEN
jgi:uncharacterized membrane protein